jgi:MFS family permease
MNRLQVPHEIPLGDRPGRVSPPAASRKPVLAGTVLAAATFVAYLPGLGRSLDFDSADTVGLFVRIGPPWSVFQRQAVFNNHPMFSFLEQLIRVITGSTSAATMRVLPILFGALAVGVLTWFAARRHGILAGVVAGGVLAVNPTFAMLSRSVRGYSLLTLCAVVSTVLVADDDRRRGWAGPAYIAAAIVGLATHLYMVPVLAAHVGMLLARRKLDERWRVRILTVLLLSALAYAGIAGDMVDATVAHHRRFRPEIPWRVAQMAMGGTWGFVLLAPVVLAGAVVAFRSRGARGAAISLGAVLFGLWAVMQSSALTVRFFVWLVPGVGYLAAVGFARVRAGAALVAASIVVALLGLVPGYVSDPSGYRPAAAVIRSVNGSGGRNCVVGVGVPLMYAYLDTPGDFAPVTRPEQLDACDLVVVAAWWPESTASWFAGDLAVLQAAEARFPYRRVLGRREAVLALSNRPIPGPGR